MSRKFEKEIEIAGTPADVWKAIAEAEGIAKWFAPGVRVTPEVGGEIWISWGEGMEGTSKIMIWEPEKHQRYVTPRPEKQNPVVVDFEIEAQTGGKTVLRLVNSGFGADAKFDNEFESVSHAWPLFLFLLKYSVEHPHQTSKTISEFRMAPMTRQAAFAKLTADPAVVDGKIVYRDDHGLICWEKGGSLLAVFCEGSKDPSYLTIMSVLYDLSPEQELEWQKLAKRVGEKIS